MLEAVAKRYASALFELARDAGRIEEIDKQSEMLLAVFADGQVKQFFALPQISVQAKKGVLDKQFSGKLDMGLLNLLKLLVDKNRIAQLESILEYYNWLTDQFRGVEDVTLVTAVPLEQAQVDEIIGQVKRFSSVPELRIHTEVDDGVIGGVKVLLGRNLVIDGTISTRLRQMRDRLVRYRHAGVGA